MTKEMIFEAIGYLGSGLVLISMLMTSVVRLRVINLIGSAVFAAYALLIRSYPTALLNIALVIINVVQLIKLGRRRGGNYEVQKLGEGEGFASWFLQLHREDILKYFPKLDVEAAKRAEGFAVFFESQAVGLMLGTRNEGEFNVLVDYTTPDYRDCSVGAFLYEELPGYGIQKLISGADTETHVQYVKKMGFTPADNGLYEKTLTGPKG